MWETNLLLMVLVLPAYPATGGIFTVKKHNRFSNNAYSVCKYIRKKKIPKVIFMLSKFPHYSDGRWQKAFSSRVEAEEKFQNEEAVIRPGLAWEQLNWARCTYVCPIKLTRRLIWTMLGIRRFLLITIADKCTHDAIAEFYDKIEINLQEAEFYTPLLRWANSRCWQMFWWSLMYYTHRTIYSHRHTEHFIHGFPKVFCQERTNLLKVFKSHRLAVELQNCFYYIYYNAQVIFQRIFKDKLKQ